MALSGLLCQRKQEKKTKRKKRALLAAALEIAGLEILTHLREGGGAGSGSRQPAEGHPQVLHSPAPPRAEAVPMEGGYPMGSSITVLVPNGSLGAGEAPSILHFSRLNKKPSLAHGLGFTEEEGAGGMHLLRAKFNSADQENFYSCTSLSSPRATLQ